MAHEIHLETNVNQVVNRDVTITVKTGPRDRLRKLGTLLISKGNIEWLPAGNSANKYRMHWADLGALLEANGRRVRINGD